MYQNISIEEAKALLEQSTVVPVVKLIPLNFDTSLSIFLKVGGNYLLESAESAETMGRYSFIGIAPRRKFVLNKTGIEDWSTGNGSSTLRCIRKETLGNPLEYAQSEMKKYTIVQDRYYLLPPFWGGLIGYLGYEGVGYFESIENLHKNDLIDIPVGIFLLPQQLLVIDHLKRQLWVIGYLESQEIKKQGLSVENAYVAANKELDAIVAQVIAPLPYKAWEYEKLIRERITRSAPALGTPALEHLKKLENMLEPEYHTSEDSYKEHVRYCVECIHRGDIIQVVPSRQISIDFDSSDDLLFYLRLRSVNPSPYMFFLRFENFAVIGSSPESMVSLDDDRKMSIKPIAGTIRRGTTKAEEVDLCSQLISDSKEQAEHLMLVDLARNDLNRIAIPGTVQVPRFMTLESFSHVWHIVSSVEGSLEADKDAFDLIRAAFPAGTLSGAPKIEAMQILGRTELYTRKAYGGMVLALGFTGYLDSCIVIRTAVIKNNRAYLQAGAGIVADSQEDKEWQETQLKLGALLQSFADIRGTRP